MATEGYKCLPEKHGRLGELSPFTKTKALNELRFRTGTDFTSIPMIPW